MSAIRKYRRGGSSHSGRRKYRYGGTSVFTNLLGRSVIRDNVQKLINSVTRPNITQKVVDAVVDGSANALKAATQKGIEKTASVITARSGFDKKKNRQAVKEAINKIVVGKGIVYD